VVAFVQRKEGDLPADFPVQVIPLVTGAANASEEALARDSAKRPETSSQFRAIASIPGY